MPETIDFHITHAGILVQLREFEAPDERAVRENWSGYVRFGRSVGRGAFRRAGLRIAAESTVVATIVMDTDGSWSPDRLTSLPIRHRRSWLRIPSVPWT